jgi:DNA-binding transcriptional MerR regulator
VSDGYLLIGAFSRASQLPAKALRLYHEAGLLVPASVDPRTGYRAYDPDQLRDAVVIRRLRQLDLPLDRIGEIVASRDPEVTRRVLAEHSAVMQERLEVVARIVADLQGGVDEPMGHTPVQVRDVPATHALVVRGTVGFDTYLAFFDRAFAAVAGMAERVGAALCGHPGALVPSEVEDDGPWPVAAYIGLAEAVALPPDRGDVCLGEVPAARVAVLTHHGSYDTVPATYLALGRWVGMHAVPTGQHVREAYVVHEGLGATPEEYRTEIQWPIEATT